MRTFRLVVAYDGTGFHGWQTQPGQRTVQGVLEEALSAVLEEGTVRVEGAGRTDAGVHARGQCASFTTSSKLPPRALPPLLNRRLPRDVRVTRADREPEGFSARRSARARRYAYRLLPSPDVLLERFAWHPPHALDLERLVRAVRPLEGDHDFSAFRGAGSSEVTPQCTLARASWTREDSFVRLDLIADHFLYRMVRNIVGTALAAAKTSDPAAEMGEILASRDRRRAGVTAPPHGLCLEEVFYPSRTFPDESAEAETRPLAPGESR